MKKRIKALGLAALIFILFFILSFALLAAIIICLKEFYEISNVVFLWCMFGVSAAIATVCTICIEANMHRFKHSKFSSWVGKSYPKLIIVYILLIYALISIQNKISWTAEETCDAVSLQWTIFGLSLAIFLVWNGIIVDFLKQKQPHTVDEQNGIKKYEFTKEKQSFSREVETAFSSIILLTINLFLLVFSTSLVYIQNLSQNIFVQNVVRCSFFFTTNSIAVLFLDILKPLKRKKTEILDKNTVSKSDEDKAITALAVQVFIDQVKKDVMDLDPEKYTEEEKKKMIIERLEAIVNSKCDNEQPATETKEN